MNLQKITILFLILLITINISVLGNDALDISNVTHKKSFFNENNTDVIIVGPYPQRASFDSIIIAWETSIETQNNSVHFGLTPDCEKIIYNNYSNYFHKIEICDLTPSMKYYYKVKSDFVESKIYSFYTSFLQNDSIRFVVYGDSRGVWDNWINAEIVANAIKKEEPYFVLHTGDIVNDGRIAEQWIDFFSISDFTHNSTLYPSIGNHENYGESYFKYFILPNNEIWYSFDSGPVHFVSLDSNFINSIKLSQIFWLIKDLIVNKQPYTIVFFHHTLYSSGNHGSTFYLRLLWGFIFDYFKVDIVFNGHD
ncbi:hypothetical protein AYK24_08735, partial [Thermoplasmatales archaeon SG8-52-4]